MFMTFDEAKAFVKKECEHYGVKFLHVSTPHVEIGGVSSNGFFADGYTEDEDSEFVDYPILAIGTSEKSYEVMIHEYCHLKQWVENPEWFKKLRELSCIWSWVSGSDEGDKITDAIIHAYDIELDCERRAVEFHKEHNTGINIDEYIQKANAYTLFYIYMRENRVWYKMGKEPYYLEEVWRKMPKTFDFDLDTVYSSVHKLFAQCAKD